MRILRKPQLVACGFPGFGEGRGPAGPLTTGWQGAFPGVPGDLGQCSSLCLLGVPVPACCLSVQLCPLCLLPALPLGVTAFLKGCGQERVPGGHLGSGAGRAIRESGQASQGGWGLPLIRSGPEPSALPSLAAPFSHPTLALGRASSLV